MITCQLLNLLDAENTLYHLFSSVRSHLMKKLILTNENIHWSIKEVFG